MARGSANRPWSEYRLGIIVTAAIAMAGLGIFLIGVAAGPFRASPTTYVVELDDAAGLRVGSLVTVGGLDAGQVTDIAIVPAREAAIPAPTMGPGDTLPLPQAFVPDARDVRVTLAVHEPFPRNVTASSRAQLAILGVGAERYVRISAGDVRERPLPPGSTIATVPSIDLDLVLGRLARALNETQEIMALTDEIRAKTAARRGSIGPLLDERAELYARLRSVQAEGRALMALIDHGPGFIGLYRRDETLQQGFDRVDANLKALRAAMNEPGGGLAAWSDPVELREAVAGLRSELADLDARLAGGRGSLGRFLNDQEIWIQVRRLNEQLAELVEGFKADPLGHVRIRIF